MASAEEGTSGDQRSPTMGGQPSSAGARTARRDLARSAERGKRARRSLRVISMLGASALVAGLLATASIVAPGISGAGAGGLDA
ncbi:MAG: hypothetical protein KGQ66_11695 [Acidobacteriota bacterium]|nr:hypothetical protein [Acidobacteriota bacterium]